MNSKTSLKMAIAGIGLVVSAMSQAKVYLDHEEHPVPFVDITVVLPVGFEARNDAESGAGNLLSDMIENGTERLDRQSFLDKLAAYGASYDFSVSNQFSYWKLSFPIVEGMNYDGLATVLAENWATPRFDKEAFDVARVKLEAALTGGLDSDMSLGITTSRRWINRNHFGGHPVFVENIKKITLDTVKAVFARDFQRSPEIWCGVVAPKSAGSLVANILTRVFQHQGRVVEGPHLEKLDVMRPADRALAKTTKTFLIVDKPDRNQSVTSVVATQPAYLDSDREVAFHFGNHILVESGLGSVFGEEIRTKRGLAYAVSAVSSYYLGLPVLGLVTNPVRPKSAEALEVISKLVRSSYETGSVFKEISDETWNRQWQSFRYSHILDRSTPMGRIGERMAVATGVLTSKLYKTPIENWDASRVDLEKTFSEHWKNSVRVASVVGDVKELRPLVEKNFPDWQIKVVPYRETIHSSAY